jgi:KaiC/GvpD/RAD55 family RecA-like ATPase
MPTLADLLDHEFPARPLLLGEWFRQGDRVLLFAKTGVGKSLLAATIALAVAGGGSVLGWAAAVPVPVLYVDGEMAGSDIQARFRMLAAGVDGGDAGLARRNITVVPMLAQDSDRDAPDLGTAQGRQWLLSVAQATAAGLVIIDNIGCLMSLEDQNDPSASAPLRAMTNALHQRGIASLTIHHEAKQGTTAMGTSTFAFPMESLLRLERDGRAANGGGAALRMTWGKHRHGPEPSPLHAALRDGRWELRKQAEGGEGGGADAVLIAAMERPEVRTYGALGRALGCAASSAHGRVSKAVAAGSLSVAQREAWEAKASRKRKPASGR